MDISKLKVAELKKELKGRGLTVTGNKSDLVERLQAALQAGISVVAGGEASSDDELEDDLLSDDVLKDNGTLGESLSPSRIGHTASSDLSDSAIDLLASPARLLDTTPVTTTTFPKVTAVTQQSQPPSQTPPVQPQQAAPRQIERLKSTENITQKREPITMEKPKPKASEASNEKSSDALSSIKILTEAERKEQRAKKFNLPLNDTDKRKVRAERFGDAAKPAATGNVADVEKIKKRAERFGAVSTQMQKIEESERINKRKERFGIVDQKEEMEVKKQKRAERFGVIA